MFSSILHPSLEVPNWNTGRFWLLRLGLYKLISPKYISDDWIWIVDHSVQIGKEKCFVILGIRMKDHPLQEDYLKHEDVEPIHIEIVEQSNAEIVFEQLESCIIKTGVPRAILSDNGSDIKGGVKLFCDKHKETDHFYDIKHMTSNILKRVLEKDEQYASFCTFASKVKNQLQQTDLACFAPVNQKSKARYMNIDELLNWANYILTILNNIDMAKDSEIKISNLKKELGENYDLNKLENKLGGLKDFKSKIQYWKELSAIMKTTVEFVRYEGYYTNCGKDLRKKLISDNPQTKAIIDDLLSLLNKESAKCGPSERMISSSEIIESVFGRQKQFEKQQCKSGFTVFILTIAASVSKTSSAIIEQALTTVSTKQLLDWKEKNIGKTLQSKKRRLINYIKNGTNMASERTEA